MWRAAVRIAVIATSIAAAGTIKAAELKSVTLHAWEQYVRGAEAGMQARLSSAGRFLWVDEDPDRLQRVRDGRIEVASLSRQGSQTVPGGLIHHWIGSAFIPHASLLQTMAVVRDYDKYKFIYTPMVVDSQTIEHSGENDRFNMRWVHNALMVTAAMDTKGCSRSVRVDERRGYVISYTTSIQEIENYGRPGEQLLPPDRGSGFIWRIYNIARYEERDGGVYLELEALGLTRDIPFTLRPIVRPLVTKLARNALLVSLTQTRDAVTRPPEEIAGRVTAGHVTAGRVTAGDVTQVTQKKSNESKGSLAMFP